MQHRRRRHRDRRAKAQWEPVGSTILAYILLGETPTPIKLLGGLLILAGIYITARQTTGVQEKFNGTPEGTRAIQLWDNRMPSYFFRIFGRPVRASVCECERSNEPSISQALHLMNSEEIMSKIRARSGAARRSGNRRFAR